jgi:hypothetical protein
MRLKTANPTRWLSLEHMEVEPMDANVKALLDKAAQATEPHHAMNFAQAALNAAHALQVLQQIEAK